MHLFPFNWCFLMSASPSLIYLLYMDTSKVPLGTEFIISYVSWWMNISSYQRVMQGYFCLMFVCPKASWLISLSLSFLIYRIEKHTFAFYNSENFSFPYSFSHAKIKKLNFLILLRIYSHYRKIIKLDK